MAKEVDFSFIRYANCWEDAGLLIRNTVPLKDERILSIASAGDNSLAFLAHDPASVLAFDVNETQLFLTELKQKAIQVLEYDEVLAFLGFSESDNREMYFDRISAELSPAALGYFRHHIALVRNGIIHQGKFENYFRIFREYVVPLIHSRKRVDELFRPKTAGEQYRFYHEKWNNMRWRMLFRIFFSRFVMGRLGRDPAFFREAKTAVGETIYQSAGRHLETTAVFDNPYLDYQLRGRFTVGLPYFLRPENFEKIRNNISRLQLFKGYLTDVPNEGKFDILNLSNIFEYMDKDTFRKQAEYLSTAVNAGSRMAYWNLLVPRKLSEVHNGFEELPLTGQDQCFFYQSFNVSRLKL
jgi:S-adenosylmethionine-diacylglycerol 3-amino-3-carboxypropyl transferase